MIENKEIYKKKLLFRASHRGIKELDIFIGRFADVNIDKLDDAELVEFEELLHLSDRDVFDWILDKKGSPKEFDTKLGDKIKNFKLFK